MKNKTRKILDFLLQDVHLRHNYFLIGGIFLILALVGYTSYSLFSYEVLSPSIYVSFKDSEKPVCVIGEPAVSLMEKSSTTTFEMNCTDNYTVADKDLTTSNFTKTGDITVTSVTKEKVGKTMKYIITVTSGTTGGVASIKLNAGAVTDTAGNGNAVSNTSEVFVRVTCDAMEEDVSGANSPEVSLASNMIPVCYNSTLDLWVKADNTNQSTDYPWYSYSGKKWANAVTVTEKNRSIYLSETAGIPISMNDINTMWVWIPRFSATSNGSYNGGTKTAPRAFNITFVDTNTAAHDAFDFGGAVSGFWIGKFENSSDITCSASNQVAVGSGCNLKTIRPKIIPNATSWRGAMVSTFFDNIQKMVEEGNQYGFDKTIDTTLDTHMLKNSEWGAVAYLTQSIYGRCSSSTSCTEIGINNNLKTGYGASAGSSSSSTNGAYNTAKGINASTTGNIYGVYDMSGGSYEYVMGMYWDGVDVTKVAYNSNITLNTNTIHTHTSGFNFSYCLNSSCNGKIRVTNGIEFPSDNKYYNLYTTSTNYTSEGLQHALTETNVWYNDAVFFVYSDRPWFSRGGYYSDSSSAGVFASVNGDNGYANINKGSRVLLVK